MRMRSDILKVTHFKRDISGTRASSLGRLYVTTNGIIIQLNYLFLCAAPTVKRPITDTA
jgi:hypothetical protein